MTIQVPSWIPRNSETGCLIYGLADSGLRDEDLTGFSMWLSAQRKQGGQERNRWAYSFMRMAASELRIGVAGRADGERRQVRFPGWYDPWTLQPNVNEFMETYSSHNWDRSHQAPRGPWPTCSEWKTIIAGALARWNPARFAPRQRMGQTPRIAQQAPRRQMVAATARRPQKLNELDSINLEIDAMESASGSPSLGVTPTEESRRGFKPSFIGVSNPARPRDLTYIKMRK